MDTRIIVAPDAVKAVEKAAAGKPLLVTPIEEGEKFPGGASAVFSCGKNLEPAIEAALFMGAQQQGILQLIADAIDCREGVELGSVERLRAHAERFAIALGLSHDDRLALERASYLRDIGKLRIPNSVLLKNGVLDYDEWSMLHSHAQLGAELLSERGLCADVVDIVRSHHECYDGDGYPDHLEKDDIPYLGRVMRILDVYCAMTSYRHYRETQATHESAAEHLLDERGKHFDPELVDVFLNANVGQTP